MGFLPKKFFFTFVLVVCCLFVANLYAIESQNEGWPTYQADNHRSGISSCQFQFPLYKNWGYKGKAPSPAWPPPAVENPRVNQLLSPVLTYDRAMVVVGENNLIFFGSSTDNTLYCFDAYTGQEKWHSITDGPIRLAPYLYDKKVYVASDDGILYCFDQISGRKIWEYGSETNELFIGNNRLISRMPIRCGIVIEDDIVYFTAGLFPSEQVNLIAVDANKGQEIWKNKMDVSPQGFLLASSQRLFVPTGRTPFMMYDRLTGKSLNPLGKSAPWAPNLFGGCRAVVIEDQIATGPSEDGQFHLFSSNLKDKIIRTDGLHLIVNKKAAYILGHHTLKAINRDRYITQKDISEQWTVKTDTPYSMIQSGDTLFCGGNGKVIAYDSSNGNIKWQFEISGKAEKMSVSNNRLFVSTNTGTIYCFSSSKEVFTNRIDMKKRVIPKEKLLLAQKLLALAVNRKGYIVIENLSDLEMMAAYCQAGAALKHIIFSIKDKNELQAVKEALYQSDFYGTHCEVVFTGKKGRILPEYFADLILSYSPVNEKEDNINLLCPDGGKLCLITEKRSDLGSDFVKMDIDAKTVYVYTRPSLEGSGTWPMTYGDGGNSACSFDKTEFKNPEILWFGRPGPHHMIDRHDRNTPPLYLNGRMFVSGRNYLYALNAYNGVVLWEKEIENSARAYLPKSCGNMAAVKDSVFIANGNKCSQFLASSGHLQKEYELPLKDKDWGYLAVSGNHLIGSTADINAVNYKAPTQASTELVWYNRDVTCSKSLFAYQFENSDLLWEYQSPGIIVNPAIAIEEGVLYFVETRKKLSQKNKGQVDLKKIARAKVGITAIDISSGEQLWHQSIDSSHMLKVMFLSASKGKLVLTGSEHVKNKYIRYAVNTYSCKDGRLLWSKSAKPSYDRVLNNEHGEQTQHPAIVNDIIYGSGFALHLNNGKNYKGWKWEKSQKCATVSLSSLYAFSRFTNSKTPYRFRLEDGEQVELTNTSRSGCWINILAVGGIILMPDFSAGCTCSYSIQASMAFKP